jgi:hypothetical protein
MGVWLFPAGTGVIRHVLELVAGAAVAVIVWAWDHVTGPTVGDLTEGRGKDGERDVEDVDRG